MVGAAQIEEMGDEKASWYVGNYDDSGKRCKE
jgi:hypothetical protein